MEKLTGKNKRWIAWLILFIILPIAYQQVKSYVDGKNQQAAMKIAKTVHVANPKVQQIYSKTESSGRLDAKYEVDVVARISGWLEKSYFTEGARIKKGQTLFLIEPDQYQIAVNNASAAVRQSHAAFVNAEKELVRAKELVKQDYVSKSYYDQALANRDGSRAAYDAAKAQLANAKLNLSYTKVTSPIDGKIGKIIISQGNLVSAQSGPLAKIVSTSPIYAYFTLKSSEFLKFKKADNSSDLSNMKVELELADGSIYQETGKIEFVDNQVDETTGTISLRASFKNEDDLLVPGDFVKVVVTSTTPQDAILVPQGAALNDAQGYYVWTVDEENKTVRKNIRVSNEENKNWIVEDGLTPEDNVVYSGVQSIRMPGQVVKTEPFVETTEDENQEIQ